MEEWQGVQRRAKGKAKQGGNQEEIKKLRKALTIKGLIRPLKGLIRRPLLAL